MTTHRDVRFPALLADFRVLLLLFISFRFFLALVYQPVMLDDGERGLTSGGDFSYFYALASLTGDDLWPYRDWWHEFPPLTSHLMVLAYNLAGERAGYSGFSLIFGFLMLAADVGSLALLRAIGTRLYDRGVGIALAWVYALMLAPVVFMWWNFESMVAFLLLLGVYGLVARRDGLSAIAAAAGALVKFTPLLLLGAVWRFRPPRDAVRYTLVSLGLFVLIYVLFFAQSVEMTLPSLTAQFGKASYQTVWSLIDGNYTTGLFGTVDSHFDPAAASATYGNPAVVPGWMRLGLAALVGLFVFLRTRRFDRRGLVAFVTLALLIFFLQAQGWSPQWLVQIIPLVLLCFPNFNGVLVVLLLTMMSFTEYPLLFTASEVGPPRVHPDMLPAFTALVVARTLLLVGLCVALYRRLRQEPAEAWE
jgi:hypothetical protein